MTAAAMEAAAKGEATVEAACQAVRVAAGKWARGKRGGHAIGGKTMAAWVEEMAREQKDPKKARRFLRMLNSWRELMPRWCDVPLHAVGDAQVREWLEQITRDYTGNTARAFLTVLRQCFKAAVRARLLEASPAEGVELPSTADSHRREAFTAAEVQLILAKFPGEWPDMVRCCLLLGGQRLGDLADLRWDAVDFAEDCVRFRTQKTKREMYKPLIAPLREVLLARRKRMGEGCEWVFPASHAKSRATLSRGFGELLMKFGILPAVEAEKKRDGRRKCMNIKTFHSLRATAVTWLLNANVPPEMVRYIVGHSGTEIERKYYYRPKMEEEARAVEKLAEGLMGGQQS